MDYGIETKGLVKKLTKKTVIDQLELAIPKGTIHGLIGSNGAGKTTTLKILSGLLPATSGTVRINNIYLGQSNEKYKEFIGYVPETPVLYDALTVRETLEFVASLYYQDYDLAEKQIQHYLDLFNLGEIEKEYTKNISRGETQRVILASVMVHNPDIILLDEPFYTLDPYSQKTLRMLLREKRDEGKTILFATHLLDLVETMCDSITLLSKGRTLFEGRVDKIKTTYPGASLEDVFIALTNIEETV